jgi:hypothetical protein
MSERYRALSDMRRFALGDALAVYDPWTDRTHELDPQTVALLGLCHEFATLREHAQRALGGAPHKGDVDALSTQLEALVARGVLCSEHSVRERLRAAAADAPAPPAIELVGFVSRDRPDDLCAALASYRLVAEAEREILVVDDSDHPTPVADVRWVSHPERVRFAARLAAHGGFDPALTAFACTRSAPGFAAGAARNCWLLHASGRLAVSFDDDVRAVLAPAPGKGEGLALGAISEHWFDLDVATEPSDPCVRHAELLGRDVRSLLDGELALDDAPATLLIAVERDGGSVVCSQLGLLGDAGSDSLGHYLLLEGASRARLHASEENYRAAFVSRQLMSAVTRATITRSSRCMAYALGVDMRRPLPPFMPRGRNADGVFGAVLRRTRRDGYMAHLPHAIVHEPQRRSSFEAMLAGMRGVEQNDLLVRIVDDERALFADEGRNMSALGARLQALGELDDASLAAELRCVMLRGRAREVALLREALLRFDHEPAYWAMDVRRVEMTLRDAMLDPDLAVPRDLAAVSAAPLRPFAAMVSNYGRLLAQWPLMLEAARELRERGAGLGETADST